MKTLRVDLGERAYPIYIGPDLLGQPELIEPFVAGSQVLIVTNETVAPLYLERVRASLSHKTVQQVVLPDGEEFKSLSVVNTIFDALLAQRFERSCTLVALGGGVVGDMTGFAAACYQRGVPFIQIPTTLLSQVDSSVGGKTGVNHPLGKNMIGAFHQPRCVVADTRTLDTLADRQLKAGMAEVIKYGLINDLAFFEWLEAHMEGLLARDQALLSDAIERSCQIKAQVVGADERERGVRALLNLGHTFGHAIETGMGYGEWLHGEAVAAGMVVAAELSVQLGWLDEGSLQRMQRLLERAGLPVQAPKSMAVERFFELMTIDKKVQDGRVRLVLMRAIGDSLVTGEVAPEQIKGALKRHLAAA